MATGDGKEIWHRQGERDECTTEMKNWREEKDGCSGRLNMQVY
jgi:hypothetical protein